MGLNNLNSTIEKIKNVEHEKSKNIDYLKKVIKNIKSESLKKNNPLKLKIDKIKNAYINNWKSNNLSKIDDITNKINLETGIPLPVLTICGKGTREIRFTEYLSFFLNPNNAHGLQFKLLKSLLNDICQEHGLSKKWYMNCIVDLKIKNK